MLKQLIETFSPPAPETLEDRALVRHQRSLTTAQEGLHFAVAMVTYHQTMVASLQRGIDERVPRSKTNVINLGLAGARA